MSAAAAVAWILALTIFLTSFVVEAVPKQAIGVSARRVRRHEKTHPLQPSDEPKRIDVPVYTNLVISVRLRAKRSVNIRIEDSDRCAGGGHVAIRRGPSSTSSGRRTATIEWRRHFKRVVDVASKHQTLRLRFGGRDVVEVWLDCQRIQKVPCRNCFGERTCLTFYRDDIVKDHVKFYSDISRPCKSFRIGVDEEDEAVTTTTSTTISTYENVDDDQLVAMWTAWTEWSRCPWACVPTATRERERACQHRQATEYESTKEESSSSSSSSPSTLDMCHGRRKEEEHCLSLMCMPDDNDPSMVLKMKTRSFDEISCHVYNGALIQRFGVASLDSKGLPFEPGCETRLVNGTNFSVVVRWAKCDVGARSSHCIDMLTVEENVIGRVDFTNNGMYVNDERVPYSSSSFHRKRLRWIFHPDYDSEWTFTLVSDLGYLVFYSPHHVRVDVTSYYFGGGGKSSIDGLCGKASLGAKSQQSVVVWPISSLDDEASRFRDAADCPLCNLRLSPHMLSAYSECGLIIKPHGPFAACHAKKKEIDPYYYMGLCASRVCRCSSRSKEEREECLCSSIAEYVRACAEKNVVMEWRTADRCPGRCPETLVYRDCGCSFTCSEYQDPDVDVSRCPSPVTKKCRSGCFCPTGHVLQRKNSPKCRPTTSCMCEHGNVSYGSGSKSSVVIKGKTCECRDGRWRCRSSPTFAASTRNVSVVLHTTIDLRCVANGYPTPTVTLLRRGLPLGSDVGSLTYTMHYIDEDALGVYECSATNELGTATIKIFATEAVPPTIIEPDMGSNLIVYESCSVVVACVAEGAPPPTVTWYHAGVKVDSLCVSTLDESRPGVGRTKCRLKWEAVSGAAAGMYRCVAVNIAGSASVDKHQSIKQIPKGVMKFAVKPKDVTSSKGQAAQFHCEPMGNPCPEDPIWYKDERRLSEDDDEGVFIKKSSQLLIVRNVTMSSSGRYECTVRNEGNDTIRAGAMLTVIDDDWDAWSSWSACNASCGNNRYRTRQRHCSGLCNEEKIDVETRRCPAAAPCPKRCYTWGNYSVVTFDGRKYAFNSSCTKQHYLARDCRHGEFYVSQEFHRSQELDAYRKAVIITFPKLERVLEFKLESHKIDLIGLITDEEKAAELLDYKIERDDMFVTFRVDGLIVRYDRVSRVYVEIGERYANATCGLCGGNVNGDAVDDFVDERGRRLSSAQDFVNAYVELANSSRCAPLDDRSYANRDADALCAGLVERDAGFDLCHDVVSPHELYEQCREFVRRCPSGVERRHCACGAIRNYVGACRLAGVDVQWNLNYSCGGDDEPCSNGKVLSLCDPFANRTCGLSLEPSPKVRRCEKQFELSCFCPTGHVMYDGRCIHSNSCPCVLRHKLYPAGYARFNECETCTCIRREWNCNPFNNKLRHCPSVYSPVDKPPQSRVALAGEPLRLCCRRGDDSDAYATPLYKWYRNGEKILEAKNYHDIKSVTTSIAGSYTCRIGNYGLMSKKATVTVLNPPQSGCKITPDARAISLPNGCEADGARELNVGHCPPSPCAHRGGGQSCDENFCCGASTFKWADVQCDGLSIGRFRVPVVDTCACNLCKSKTSVYGRVVYDRAVSAKDVPSVVVANVANPTSAFRVVVGGWFDYIIGGNVQFLALKFSDIKQSRFPPFVKLIPFTYDRRVYHEIHMLSWSQRHSLTSDKLETIRLAVREYSSSSLRLTTTLEVGFRSSFELDSTVGEVRIDYKDRTSIKSPDEAPGNYEEIFTDGSHGLIRPLFIIQVDVVATPESLRPDLQQPLKLSLVKETKGNANKVDLFPSLQSSSLRLFALLESSGLWSNYLAAPVVSLPTDARANDEWRTDQKVIFNVPELERSFAVGESVPTCYARVGVVNIVGYRVSGVLVASIVRYDEPYMTTISHGITNAAGTACVPIACYEETALSATQAFGSMKIDLEPASSSYSNRFVSFHHEAEIRVRAGATTTTRESAPLYSSLDRCEGELNDDLLFSFVTSEMSTSFTAVELDGERRTAMSWHSVYSYFVKVSVVSASQQEYNVRASTFAFDPVTGQFQLYGWRQQRTANWSSTVCLEFTFPQDKRQIGVVVLISVEPVLNDGDGGALCYKTKAKRPVVEEASKTPYDDGSREKMNEFIFHPPTLTFGREVGYYKDSFHAMAERICHIWNGTAVEFQCP